MIKVTVRYYELTPEEGFVLGEFPPSEIQPLVELVKKYGVQAYTKSGDTAIEAGNDLYMDSQWYIHENTNQFEIIVG